MGTDDTELEEILAASPMPEAWKAHARKRAAEANPAHRPAVLARIKRESGKKMHTK